MPAYHIKDRRLCSAETGNAPIPRTSLPALYFGEQVEFAFTFPEGVLAAGDIVRLAVDSDKDFLATAPMAVAAVELDAASTSVSITLNTRTARFRDIVNARPAPIVAFLEVTRWRTDAGGARVATVLCDSACTVRSIVSDYGDDVDILPKTVTIPVPSAADTGKVVGVDDSGKYALVSNGGGGGDGSGDGDMRKSVYDTDDNGKVDAADAADAVPWNGVTDKPETFAPSPHGHNYSDIIDPPAVDTELSDTSANAVQNKAVKAALDLKQDKLSAANRLAASYVADDSTHRFVTDTEKAAWNTAGGGGAQAQVIESTATALEVTAAGGVYRWTPDGDGALSITGTQAGYEAFVNIAIVLGEANVITVTGITLIDALTASRVNYCCIYYDGTTARLFVVDVRTT